MDLLPIRGFDDRQAVFLIDEFNKVLAHDVVAVVDVTA